MAGGGRVKVQAIRLSGYVPGPCDQCGQEERAILMFDDYSYGMECLACGHMVKDVEVEWIEDS